MIIQSIECVWEREREREREKTSRKYQMQLSVALIKDLFNWNWFESNEPGALLFLEWKLCVLKSIIEAIEFDLLVDVKCSASLLKQCFRFMTNIPF